MPHPRPTGAVQALSSRLRAETMGLHKDAERRPFMRSFFAGELPREAYVGWLERQYPIYRALEAGLGSLPSSSPESTIVPASLYRAERIAADLRLLRHGRLPPDMVTPAAAAYVERIEHVSAHGLPASIVAHAWIRYMGNVGGRDVLRRLAAAAIGVGEDRTDGLSFTDFSAVGEIRPFFARFHAGLDGLVLTESEIDVVVAEAANGFRLNIALTDELAADFGIA